MKSDEKRSWIFNYRGRVVPQARPRVVLGRKPRAFTPAASAACRRSMAARFRQFLSKPIHPLACPISVVMTFAIEQPRTGAGRLTAAAKRPHPVHPVSGDLDNLVKQTLDALQDAGVIADDRWVVTLRAHKVWAGEEAPGVALYIQEA